MSRDPPLMRAYQLNSVADEMTPYLASESAVERRLAPAGIVTCATGPVSGPLPHAATAASTQHPASARRALLGEPERMLEQNCLLYTSPSPRDGLLSRMPS